MDAITVPVVLFTIWDLGMLLYVPISISGLLLNLWWVALCVHCRLTGLNSLNTVQHVVSQQRYPLPEGLSANETTVTAALKKKKGA